MINDLKEFEKLLKICRKQGIETLSMEGISIKFGELPKKKDGEAEEEISTDEPTTEELMNWSIPRENN